MNEITQIAPRHKNVYMALCAAQSEMDPLTKGALNPAFKGEGKPKGTAYADLADVVQVVRPPLTRHGVAFFHQTIRDEHGQFERTSLVHGETETRIDCDVPLIVGKNDMQGMKSAITYAKRIGLESLTGVAPEDDDGNDAAKSPIIEARKVEPRQIEAAPVLISADQYTALQAKADLAGVDLAVVAGILNIPQIEQLRAYDFLSVMRKLDATIAAKPKPANADLSGDEVPY